MDRCHRARRRGSRIETGGSGVKQITYSATGAEPIAATAVVGATTGIVVSHEGSTTITFFGTDNAGNAESPQSVTILLDKTPPTITCSASPNSLWPLDNKLVNVKTSVTVVSFQPSEGKPRDAR